MFFVVTRYEGIKYTYTINKGEEAPEITLFSEEETEESNGTNIVVPIKSGDLSTFKREIKRQLQYFDNINYENCDVPNDFTIYRGENFMYRSPRISDKLHIVLGKVFYPIDNEALGLSTRYSYGRARTGSCPIALRFEIGELPVVWNRENIEYNDKAIETIKKKIEDVKEELQSMYSERYSDIDNLEDFLEAKEMSRSNSLNITDDVSIPKVSGLIDTDPIYPKYHKHLSSIPKDIFFDYTTHRKVSHGLIESEDRLPSVKRLIDIKEDNDDVYLCKGKYKTKKNKYIFYKKDKPKFYIIRKKPDSELQDSSDLSYGFIKSRSPTDEQTDLIEEFREEVDEFVEEKVNVYEDVDVPDFFDDWLRKHDKGGSAQKSLAYNPDSEIPYKPIYFDSDTSFGAGKVESYNFSRGHIKISDLVESDQLMIYGHRADSDRLQVTSSIIFSRKEFLDNSYYGNNDRLDTKAVRIFKISKSNVSLIEDKINAYHVDDFMESKHRILKKFVTARHLAVEVPGEFWNIDYEFFRRISEELEETFINLKDYRTRYYDTSRYGFNDRDEIWNYIEDLFEKEELYDEDIMKDLELLQLYVEKFPLFKYISVPNEEAAEELEFYMKAKGEVHPSLLKRYKKFKNSKTCQKTT